MSDGFVWTENPVTRQKARIVRHPRDNGGTAFEFEFLIDPRTGRESFPLHFHPKWKERFEIVRGRARCLIDGQESEGGPGHVFVCPPGVAHWHPWSVSDEELCFRQIVEVDPPDLEGLLTGIRIGLALNGLARAGKVNRKGYPDPLQSALLIQSGMPHIMVAKGPVWLTSLLARALAPIARLLGYRAFRPEYGEV
jgi:quercetin dioxygenase-like cupin family protein